MSGIEAFQQLGEAAIIGLLLSVPQPNIPDRSAECLALNMYHEARGQGIAGELAVTAVVLNRVNDKRYPNTICEVVEQGPTRASWQNPQVRYPIKNRCQFSWFCDGKSDKPRDKKSWKWSQQIARLVVSGLLEDVTGGATHYHAHYVSPKWRTTKTFTVKIGSHLYYKKRGRKDGH